MRISDLQVHLVHAPIPEAQRVVSGAGLKYARQAAIIELQTDDEISGFGPCSFGSATVALGAVRTLMEDAFAPVVLGIDPFASEELWDALYYGLVLRVFGTQSLGVALLSAIDIALWDIKGKVTGQPIYRLLGAARDRVPVYASSIYWSTPEEAADSAQRFVEDGFKAVKFKASGDVGADARAVGAIRNRVGSGVDIMVDANMRYTTARALRLGRSLQEYGVFFFEEPISIDDVAGHAELARELDVPIATGENIYTRFGFLPFFEQRALDVVQADASRTGGISEARRVADIAGAYHLGYAPHTFGDIFTTAANLHVTASCGNALFLEYDCTYNPLMSDLAREGGLRIEDGEALLPDRPGLGFSLDREFVTHHPYDGQQGISLGFKPSFGRAAELAPLTQIGKRS